MELSTKAILLSERFHWKLTCCQGAFNESQLVLGELSIACFRRAFNKSIIFFATDCSINFLSINLIFCNSNSIITTIIPLSVPNTKYNIKYHIHHLEYKIHRSKYSMTGPLSQDTKIHWKWDNRKQNWRKVQSVGWLVGHTYRFPLRTVTEWWCITSSQASKLC